MASDNKTTTTAISTNLGFLQGYTENDLLWAARQERDARRRALCGVGHERLFYAIDGYMQRFYTAGVELIRRNAARDLAATAGVVIRPAPPVVPLPVAPPCLKRSREPVVYNVSGLPSPSPSPPAPASDPARDAKTQSDVPDPKRTRVEEEPKPL